MSSALTYIAVANFFGNCSQPAQNAPAVTSGSISGPLQVPLQFQTSRYNKTNTPSIGTHRVPTGLSTWNAARRACQDQGGHLAIVNSAAEAEAISKILKESDVGRAWVGVHDFYQEDEFVTIHGESLTKTGYDVWQAGEPNNAGGNENCLVLSSEGKFNDDTCTSRFRGICEFPYVQPSYPLPTLTQPEPTPATESANPGIA